MNLLRFVVLFLLLLGCAGCGSELSSEPPPAFANHVGMTNQVNGVAQGDFIAFPQTFIGTLETVSVRTPIGITPVTTYAEGRDYIADSQGNITILFGGDIARSGADNIAIVYQLTYKWISPDQIHVNP